MANAGNPTQIATPTKPPSVFDQSSGAFTSGLNATSGAGAMNPALAGQAQGVFNTGVGLAEAAATAPDINAFRNPFTAAVTDTTLSGLDRARQLAQIGTDAAATKAGAFGGSRHGVLGAETNKNFFDTAATTLAGLNESGFNTSLTAAQEARRAQLASGGMLGNMAQGLAGVGQEQQRIGLSQGAQFGSLGQMLFGVGSSVSDRVGAQGGQQQMLVQALIDAAKGQFGGLTSAPQASLNGPLAALSSANMGQNTSTTKQQPGLLNILGAAFGML